MAITAEQRKKILASPDFKKLIGGQAEKKTQTSSSGVSLIERARELRGGTIEQEDVAVEEKPGLFKRISEKFKARSTELGETLQEEDPITGAVATAAAGVGTVFDVATEGAKSLFSFLTPDFIEKPVSDKLAKLGTQFAESEAGQTALKAIEGGVEMYEDFAEKHPTLAKNIESVATLAEIFPAAKGAKVLKEGGETAVKGVARVAGEGAEAVEQRLKKQITQEALDIVQPNAKTLSTAERAKRLEQGLGEQTSLTGKRQLQPSTEDIRSAEIVNDIVKKSNTPFENIDAINSNIVSRSEKLENALENIEWEFDRDLIKDDFVKLKDSSKVLFGGEKAIENTYDTVANEFSRIFSKKPNTLAGLLAARKEFDQVVKQKFPNIFDKVGGDNVRANAVSDVRNSVNNFIATKAPERILGKDVKDELSNISSMYNARKNISKNVLADLDTTRIQRATKNLTGGLTGTLLLAGGLTVGGLTGLLSSPAALAAIIGGGTFKIGKSIITSKKLKEGIIKLLDFVGDRKIDAKDAQSFQDILLQLEAPQAIRGKIFQKTDTSGIIKEPRPGQQVLEKDFPKLEAGSTRLGPKADTSSVKSVEAKSIVVRDPKTGRFKKVFTTETK